METQVLSTVVQIKMPTSLWRKLARRAKAVGLRPSTFARVLISKVLADIDDGRLLFARKTSGDDHLAES